MKQIRLIRCTILTNILILSCSMIASAELNDAVVKVFVTSSSIDYYRPWQSKGISAGGGSGVIIDGNRILTNAHVVEDHTFIQIKKNHDPKKYTARAIVIGHDCDLALLTVDDPEFFEGVPKVQFGELPLLRDSVVVLGYPQGGGKLSITEGVVSRVEINSYSQSGRQLLAVQIDAAINPGNSGGPVFKDGKMVGVVMQSLQKGQNIGYMIPIPIINHFIEDYEDGHYDGFPIMGIEYNTTENTSLRETYKITNQEGGVLITRVLPYSPAFDALRKDDVIIEIDGTKVSEDGTFSFRKNERLGLSYLIVKRHIGEKIHITVIRNGDKIPIAFQLSPFKVLVAHPNHYEKPPYFIYGGLVFTVLSTDLLKSWGNRWWEQAPLDLTYYFVGNGRLNTQNREDIIVLLNVLPDDVNIGYHNYRNDIVTKINGESFTSFKEFIQYLNKIKVKERFTIIETENQNRIILDNTNIDKIDEQIIERNNIPYRFSKDVAEWIK